MIKPLPLSFTKSTSKRVARVRDASGNPVSASTISTTVNGRSVSRLTNAQGNASFSNIAVGQYSYSVSKAGYYSPLSNMALSITGGVTTASKYVLFQYGKAKVKVKFVCQKLGDYIVSVNKAGYIGSSKDVHAVNMGMAYDLTMEMPAAQ